MMDLIRRKIKEEEMRNGRVVKKRIMSHIIHLEESNRLALT